MSAQQLELALAREKLLARSTLLRERVAEQSAALTPILAVGDRVRDGAHWLRTHPALVATAVVVVAVIRPRVVWRWSLRALTAWRIVRRWRSRLDGLTMP